MTLNNGILDIGKLGAIWSSARAMSKRVPLRYGSEAYAAEPDRRFPVVYMQDGQNVFDPAASFGE